jgi:hypothetical protein
MIKKMKQKEYLEMKNAKITNLNVLDKLMKKLIYFEGKLERAISLAERINRVFIIERNYRGFMKGKASWVQEYYMGRHIELNLIKKGAFRELKNAKRSYKKIFNKYVYKKNGNYYLASNLTSLNEIIKKEQEKKEKKDKGTEKTFKKKPISKMDVFEKVHKLLEEKDIDYKYEYDKEDSNAVFLHFSTASNNIFHVVKHLRENSRTSIEKQVWNIEMPDPNNPKETIIGDYKKRISFEQLKSELYYY